MDQQIGEVTVAYFEKRHPGWDHIVIVDGSDAGAFIDRGDWHQITQEDYAAKRKLSKVQDLRRKPQ